MRAPAPYHIVNTGVNITTSATSASQPIPNNSAGVPADYILVTATANANIRVGKTTATAIATDFMITPGIAAVLNTCDFDVIAAIQTSGPGIVNVTPLEM
jgi:hypothetical protein